MRGLTPKPPPASMTLALNEALPAAAAALGLTPDQLRVQVGRQLQRQYAESCSALISSLNGFSFVPLSNKFDLEDRHVRAHLSGENKPGVRWPGYKQWFEGEIAGLKDDEARAVATTHLTSADNSHSTWRLWSKPGRPSKKEGGSFPKNVGDPDLVRGALAALENAAAKIRAVVVPLDLQPPLIDSVVARPAYSAEMDMAGTRFAVVLQGPPGAGKRHVLWHFLKAREEKILWFHAGVVARFAEVLERSAEVMAVKASPAGVYEGLVKNDLVIVIDGIAAASRDSFLPALQAAARMRGPARLFACSRVRLNDCNAMEIAPFRHGQVTDLNAGDSWQAEPLYGHLTLPERKILGLLQELGNEVDARSVEVALRHCGIPQQATEFLTALEDKFALTRAARATWIIEASLMNSPGPHADRATRQAFFMDIGTTFEQEAWRLIKGNGPPPKGQLCHLAYRACRALQIAQAQHKRWAKLLGHVSRDMRARGMISELRKLHEFEVNNMPRRSPWTDVRLANYLHVQGEPEAELGILERVFYAGPYPGHEPNLSVHLKRAFAELLIDLDQPELAAAMLDAAFRSQPLSGLQATVAAQVLSTLSWALILAGRPDESLRINTEVLGREFELFETRIARAVRHARIGVACRSKGDYPQAIEALSEAHALFSEVDRRGAGWSAMHLAEANRLGGNTAEACRWYRTGSEISASHQTFDPDFTLIGKEFSADPACADVAQQARQEVERMARYEEERGRVAARIINSSFLLHVCASIGVSVNSSGVDVSKLQLTRSLAQNKMASEFNRSLVSAVAKDDPGGCLEKVFRSRSPQLVFSNPLLNKVVTDACRFAPTLAPVYVLPHLELIAGQHDSIRLHYARHLEIAGDAESARQLLTSVEKQDSFTYLNIQANVMARDPSRTVEVMKLNELALTKARRALDRMRIRTNMARTLYQHRRKEQFHLAILYCEQALQEDVRGNFNWPANLVLMLRLEVESTREARETIEEHIKRYPTRYSFLAREVVPQILDQRARQRAAIALEELQRQNDAGASPEVA